jgi:hypothetical protein
MNIPWHKVTWYTKLGALLLFVVVVPIISFYIGREYQKTIEALAVLRAHEQRAAMMLAKAQEIKTISASVAEATLPETKPEPKTEVVNDDNLTTFTSDNLGITFQYASHPTSGRYQGKTITVTELGSKVYVSRSDIKPEQGQSVEVFSKKKEETLPEAIKRQILKDYSLDDCRIILLSPQDSKMVRQGFTSAEITYPMSESPDASYTANASWCNESYDQSNGLRYFLTDPQHPDKFFFFDIGQYSIMATGTDAWQQTFKVLK